MRTVRHHLWIVLLLTSLIATPAYGISPVGTETNATAYQDLANNTDDFLGVGAVSIPGALCSGTWLGGEYVLTARHCGGSAGNISISFVNGESVGSVGYWASNLSGNHNDLAIFRLARTPNLPANYLPGKVRANNNGVVGQLGSLVGYGGIGRSAGHNTVVNASNTGEVNAWRPTASGLQLGAVLIPGDSGGPLMVQEPDDSFSVIGVASVIFGNYDVWANPTAYSDQIEFGMLTGNFGFFQDGLPAPVIGDLTLDGLVNSADEQAFIDGWLSEHASADVAAWQAGDLNGDRIADLADAFILREALAAQGIAMDLSSLAVPEPASGSLVLISAILAGVIVRSRPLR